MPEDKKKQSLLKELKDLEKDLRSRLVAGENPKKLIKDDRLKDFFSKLGQNSSEVAKDFGQKLNRLKKELLNSNKERPKETTKEADYFDPTAPIAINGPSRPILPNPEDGSVHPINSALKEVLDIFAKMGFGAVESRQVDSEYYMFEALNFAVNHPTRDEFDTFFLKQTAQGRPLLAPAHTSTMQNRILTGGKEILKTGQPLAMVIPGRVFRNEDVDASHDHMFYQLEGIYVAKDVSVANLVATLKEFMQSYYQRPDLKVKIQPFYFPFTEPSFEMAISCPFCDQKGGCRVCSVGWIELLGCGLIHPNVLAAAGLNPKNYSGFAWGMGLMRLVMIKDNIEDIRHFASGKLAFLRQF